MTKQIIMTGSRGRLASVLQRHFAHRSGFRVYGLSRAQGDGHLGYSDAFNSTLLENTDVFLHLAWSTVPIVSERKPGLEWEIDLPELTRLLSVITGVPEIREKLHFVFFSSAGTMYGNATNRPSVETDPPAPLGWHGAGKAAAEYLINQFVIRAGLRATVLRVSNPYGFRYAAHRPQGVIPMLIRAAEQGTPFGVWGDGHARKDFLYYSDMTAAVEAVVERRLLGTYNLSAGESHSVREIADAVGKLVGRPIDLEFSPHCGWDVTNSEIDNSLLSQKANWRPLVALEEGLQRTIDEQRISSQL